MILKYIAPYRWSCSWCDLRMQLQVIRCPSSIIPIQVLYFHKMILVCFAAERPDQNKSVSVIRRSLRLISRHLLSMKIGVRKFSDSMQHNCFGNSKVHSPILNKKSLINFKSYLISISFLLIRYKYVLCRFD